MCVCVLNFFVDGFFCFVQVTIMMAGYFILVSQVTSTFSHFYSPFCLEHR
jgi:hypothetical protein